MAFWTTLLIIHGLLAVALLGAITHQAVSVWMPVRSKAGNFVTRFRAVPSTSYVTAIIVLYVVTFIMGAWIYTQYRFTSRLALEQLRFFKTVGVFEMKEHVATIGIILLPAYWAFWRQPLSEDYAAARKNVTLLLAIVVWTNFLIVYRQQCPGIWLMMPSSKLAVFTIVFGVAFAVIYVVCTELNLPLLTYHPVIGEVDFLWTPERRVRPCIGKAGC